MSDVASFQDYVTAERERLSQARSQWLSDQREAQSQIAEIDREFEAIKAYEAAKTGKPAKTNRAATRTRRGSRREAILQAVAAAPDGMRRGELLEHFGLKGDRAGEMSVSNALTALTKTEQVQREGGKYRLSVRPEEPVSATAALQEAAE